MSDEFYYRERLIDHYKHPRRKGLLATPDARSHDHNPFCGDEVTIDLTFDQGAVTDAAFDGRGCSICRTRRSSTASRSTACELPEPTPEIGSDLPR